MKIGLVLSLLRHLPLPEAIKIAADYGYEAVELNVEKNGGQVDLETALESGNAKKIKKLVADHGLFISALGNHAEGQLILGPYNEDTDLIYKGSQEEKIAFGTRRILQTAQLASELEVPVVTGFCGCEDYSRWFPWPDENAWEKMAGPFIERWGKILDTFASYGVKFAHECHPKQLAYNIETAEWTLKLLGNRPEWGFNLDPANLLLSGVDPLVFIDVFKERIFHVHAKDGEVVTQNASRSGIMAHGDWRRLDRGFRFRIPGWGDIPWKKIITELRLVNYDYVLSVEHEDPTMSRKDGIEKSIHYLKPIIINEPFEGRWW